MNVATSRDSLLYILNSDPEVHVDRSCLPEIRDIVMKSGNTLRFVKDYQARIQRLKELGELAHSRQPEWFEKLRHIKGSTLYSLRFIRIDNMRILYAVISNRYILLCAFKEKGKGTSKTQSYRQYTDIALRRLDEYTKEN